MIRGVSFAVPVALAVAVLVAVVAGRAPPERTEPGERAQSARVIAVAPRPFVPRAVGYGSVAPARSWDAVAQVPGRVAYVHPDLRVGAVLPEGTEIIRISPEDYELALREATANLEAAKARLRELETRAANTDRSLEIERRALEIKRAEFERQRGLVERGVSSDAALDVVERDVLQQQVRVQELENTALLLPAEIETQETQIEVAAARLAIAELDLERTRIRMPFRGRIAESMVEATQFVSAGARLASAGDIGAAEIVAQVPQDRFAKFVALATPEDFRAEFGGEGEMGAMFESLGWTAEVSLGLAGTDARWPARIRRTSDTIDATTRTVGVIVQVEEPYRDVRPGRRPPLVKGMFVRVELSGPPLEGRIVVPRAALHDGRVHVATAENRLEIRPVEVRAVQGEEALIAEGLAPGERVVVSALTPAIPGMLLDPVPADRAEAAAE